MSLLKDLYNQQQILCTIEILIKNYWKTVTMINENHKKEFALKIKKWKKLNSGFSSFVFV